MYTRNPNTAGIVSTWNGLFLRQAMWSDFLNTLVIGSVLNALVLTWGSSLIRKNQVVLTLIVSMRRRRYSNGWWLVILLRHDGKLHEGERKRYTEKNKMLILTYRYWTRRTGIASRPALGRSRRIVSTSGGSSPSGLLGGGSPRLIQRGLNEEKKKKERERDVSVLGCR
jgi:hypothetical protein